MQNCPNSGKPPHSGNPEPSPAESSREGVETRRAAPKSRIDPGDGEGIVQTANRTESVRAKAAPGGESRRR